ncbi:ABC transporter permease subunit [Streptomyces antarcticus]|uniref:ABC transporter permease subunit n=1 Tax=Streptomyces antarcticus TaxID=2996458 RepID=UPI00226D91D0|nr:MULTISPECIES: ABC transporter permease [unclassified Streptomyces]MCY0943835.1 ABC transporter permease [Streptomyces sp. H34-AA3]MCZ4085707.1 ABC transporter permease [Streptomyces sp. H34-S5]
MSTLALKGPYWVAVRQHRRVLRAVAGALTAGLVAVVVLRLWANSPDAAGRYVTGPNHGYDLLRLCVQYAGAGLRFLPPLVGAFVAGPMLARELESGTWRLALTQSTTPRAWLGSKVLVAASVTVLGSAALVGVYRLGWARVSGTYWLYWHDQGPYEASGPVLVASCLLGVAVGALVGQLIRRTLAAMAVTGLVTGLVLLALGSVRWSFLAVETASMPLSGSTAQLLPPSAYLTDAGVLTTTGERLPEYTCFAWDPEVGACKAVTNVTARYADFHPLSHYWPTQLLESGILLALTAALLCAAFRLLRARRG